MEHALTHPTTRQSLPIHSIVDVHAFRTSYRHRAIPRAASCQYSNVSSVIPTLRS